MRHSSQRRSQSSKSPKNRPPSTGTEKRGSVLRSHSSRLWPVAPLAGIAVLWTLIVGHTAWRLWVAEPIEDPQVLAATSQLQGVSELASIIVPAQNGRPKLIPLPEAEEVWQCEVVVIGGSLGGVAAASHSMASGAQTCLIEVTPWLGGQISSQGVSAIDESWTMRWGDKFSTSWERFKSIIEEQTVELPGWAGGTSRKVSQLNSCWVGPLCFLPEAGDRASTALLEEVAQYAPDSQWAASTAFKGAEFSDDGRRITAIYAVRREPRDETYQPKGQLWEELNVWYGWSDTDEFRKTPLRIEPPPGEDFIVIDATDTGELVGWAKIPHRQGSDAQSVANEPNAPGKSNPECTQAFTFPFLLAIHNDGGKSLERLKAQDSDYNLIEHWRAYSLNGFPTFSGRSFFNYRRVVSLIQNDPIRGTPIPGDITVVNWNPGNDWNWMNPPLILTEERLEASDQYRNWMGGLSVSALRQGASHALLFARWLVEIQSLPDYPLSILHGSDSPMGTDSGLSMMPYIREGRRIIGYPAYGQDEFMVREMDVRWDLPGARDMRDTVVALTHYSVDIHGCRYRNWEPSLEASGAPAHEGKVRPVYIPLEGLIPIGVDNMLVGGKAIAVSHIVNAITRIHYGEWSVGAAAGATAGWLVTDHDLALDPKHIIDEGHMADLQQYLKEQGLRLNW
ncbi:MAG: FAD-dependent oxidoreductase [Leptolyngbyaceae bacterium]|nr:FAD-dependent oxidoreductase [Leptolyngbyaceae bacterium]